jgi:hypothetical protein
MTNDHEISINNVNSKLKDLNIFEMFKSDDNENEEDDKGKSLIEKLEKLSSKIKLTTEKMSKVDETNFKLVKETQNIKNAQAMNTRNISLNKKALEEILSKTNEIEKKLNIDSNKDNKSITTPINQLSEYIVSDSNDKNNLGNKSKKSNLKNQNLDMINPEFKDIILEANKELEKKLREINKKVNELDKLTKKFSTLDNYYEIKNELNNIKKESNKFATNADLKAVYNKSEENEKEIKLIKTKNEDLEINLDLKDDLKSLKKRVELYHNLIENLETSTKNLKKDIETEINEKESLNENLKNLLEKKIFEDFKNQLTKEFSNINVNFIHTRKLLDEIIEAMKEKVSYQDLKIFEKSFEARLENMQLTSYKKFAEKSDTIKNFKYIETQIKSLFEILQKRSGDNDGWLLAKKPLNLNLCASCESYLGDLKDNNPYVPWNKYPLRDSNDKLYRLGNGYSKMLQMLNVEENDKKNMSSAGLGMNFKEDLANMVKKSDKNENGDLSSDLTNNINFNKTMGNLFKSPKKNFPLIKKKILAKNRSEIGNLDEYKNDKVEESKNKRNKNNDLDNIKDIENFGTNTENRIYENDDENVIVPTSPKITKIIKKK